MADGEHEVIASPEPPETVRSISVQLDGLDQVAPQFANLIHANNDRQVFQIVFSQLMPPLVLGPEDSEAFLQRGSISATVVARVVLTPLVLEQFIDVLRTQLARYQESQEDAASRPPASADG